MAFIADHYSRFQPSNENDWYRCYLLGRFHDRDDICCALSVTVELIYIDNDVKKISNIITQNFFYKRSINKTIFYTEALRIIV